MKMETTVQAPKDGIVKEIYAKAGDAISTGDLLIELEQNTSGWVNMKSAANLELKICGALFCLLLKTIVLRCGGRFQGGTRV